MTDLTGELIAAARQLLTAGNVSSVLGYERDPRTGLARPGWVRSPEEADRLVWDHTCVHNLVRFLVDVRKLQSRPDSPDSQPIGVVVKGCDSRAITVLLQERLLDRQAVYLIGVSCGRGGVVDRRKLAARLAGDAPNSIDLDAEGVFQVGTAAGQLSIPADELLADRCRECRQPWPKVCDVLLGEPAERSVAQRFAAVAAMEALSAAERWAFWEREFSRCLRCHACRSVCPMCYCPECVVDSSQYAVTAETTAEEKAQRPRWVERSALVAENAFYHLVRAIHMAGRCIDCQECERVCPVNIPLRLLYRAIEKEARSMFDYETGMDPDAPALIASFRIEDPGDFIR